MDFHLFFLVENLGGFSYQNNHLTKLFKATKQYFSGVFDKDILRKKDYYIFAISFLAIHIIFNLANRVY